MPPPWYKEGWMEALPWVFHLLRQCEMHLHWIDSPELALQDDITFVGYDGIWRHITLFDPLSWIRNLGFHHFLKYSKKKITEIYTKTSQNAYEMYKFVSLCNLMKRTGKKSSELFQKSWFVDRPTFVVTMSTSKMMGTQLIDQLLRRMNELLLKFSSLRVNYLLKTLERKTSWKVGVHSPTTPPTSLPPPPSRTPPCMSKW